MRERTDKEHINTQIVVSHENIQLLCNNWMCILNCASDSFRNNPRFYSAGEWIGDDDDDDDEG